MKASISAYGLFQPIDCVVTAGPTINPMLTAREIARNPPRWRGFNLLWLFIKGRSEARVEEDELRWLAEWGFDFARLPMDYRFWTDPQDPYRYDEAKLAIIDATVALAGRLGVHLNLCLHRAPGFTVAHPQETLSLWADDEAQRRFAAQWAMFARRYRGIPSTRLSFDLVNEPFGTTAELYGAVVRRTCATIWHHDPDRLVTIDGLQFGTVPVPELADLPVIQSTRGYAPFEVTHHRATWCNRTNWPEPSWPHRNSGDGTLEDAAWLERTAIAPWRALRAQGVGVHVGEFGCFNRTPHRVVLPWLEAQLGLWRAEDWGWAMWNLRGAFGVVDSGRADAAYEPFRGHRLDRAMLELLRRG